ncbi:MAG: DNA polymerase III subunit [Clostridiales bacterium]|jgi:putative DNA polymerase III, delta' subunit|nr:DNA polymerase III subunit [Clostridiales bacterium]
MFEDILGNDDVKKYLTNCIENKNFSHSYIFSGIKGVGKYTFAKDFAKCILEDPMMQDYYELEPDGKSIKVAQIRELQNVINIKPTFSEKSVYIIDDADLMTTEAQNSLLKTLEEPPEYAVIILIVHNERSVLSTVKSRCVNIKFNKLSDKDIKKYFLKNDLNFEDKNINVFKVLDGSLNDIDFIRDDYDELLKLTVFVTNLKKNKVINFFQDASVFYDNHDKIIRLLEYLNMLLFENSYFQLIEIVEKTKNKILMNNNFEMCIDYMILNFIEELY